MTQLLANVQYHGGACAESMWMGSDYLYSIVCSQGHSEPISGKSLMAGHWCGRCAYDDARTHRSEDEKAAARREAALRFARKPESKIKARKRYERVSQTPEFKRQCKAQRLLRDFSMHIDNYEQRIEEQDGKCALCGVELGPDGNRDALAPVVDHCHETGNIRGILHRKCNSAIGFLGDSVDLARRAVSYLEASRG